MSGEAKLTKALPFPQNWHMTEGAHFNGGKEWFGYRMNCTEQPRLSRFDRYTRKDRSVASTWEVDGVGCADADAAWLALQTPPEVTAEERAALALIGDEPADMRQVIPYEMCHSLRAKGLIEYGPPGRCKRTPAGLAALSQNISIPRKPGLGSESRPGDGVPPDRDLHPQERAGHVAQGRWLDADQRDARQVVERPQPPARRQAPD